MADEFASVRGGSSSTDPEGPASYEKLLRQMMAMRKVREEPYEGHKPYDESFTGGMHKRLDRFVDRALHQGASEVESQLKPIGSVNRGIDDAVERQKQRRAAAYDIIFPPSQAQGPLRGTEPKDTIQASPFATETTDPGARLVGSLLAPDATNLFLPAKGAVVAGKTLLAAGAPLIAKLGKTAEKAAVTEAEKIAARKFGAPLERVADEAPYVEHQVVPQSVIDMGASKEKREASAARRAAEAAERDAPVREAPRTKEERAAVAPDKYRQLYNEQGEKAVMDAAKAGEHIRGEFVGFPRDVTSQRGVNRMRTSLDKQLGDAKSALEFAEDPARVGNWYPRARAGIVETTEPSLLDRTLEGHGTFSAGVAPENEIVFALRHGQSRGMGAPQRGFRGAQEKELDDAVKENRAASLRFKIDEYRRKNDARLGQGQPFGTNDFRSAQEFGYTDAKGNKWKAGVSDQMHPVMDAERALVVDRARARGDTGMTGEMAQEYPWVLGKAEDMYLQGKFAGANEIESKINALREANKTTADYAPKHAMTMTYGTRPGEGIGHREDILKLPLEEQRAYNRDVFTRPPTGADPHPRDIMYSAHGQRQLPPIEGSGSWMGEAEPIVMARPLAYPKVGSVMEVPPEQMHAFQATEMLRGLGLGQRAVAGNMPVTMQSRGGKTGMLIERLRMNDVGNPASHVPTAAEMQALEPVAARYNYMVTPTSRGAQLIPMSGKDAFGHPIPPPDKLMRDLKKHGGFEEAESALPGGKAMQAGNEGFYRDVVPEEAQMGKGVATGRVIKQLARAPAGVSKGLSGSKEVRDAFATLQETDALEHARTGVKISEPLQKSREFFAKEDYDKVVALVRKGIKVPAAMAALGFSLKGMAAEDVAAIEKEASR